jgi:hypothetical protein
MMHLTCNVRLSQRFGTLRFTARVPFVVRKAGRYDLERGSDAPRQFSTVQAAVEAIARGEVVIVVDAEDRENEGDYICAAEKATTENINFIMSGRGIPCLSVSARSGPASRVIAPWPTRIRPRRERPM